MHFFDRAYESEAGQLQHDHQDGHVNLPDYGTLKLSLLPGL